MTDCARCQKTLEAGWSYCPYCGRAAGAAKYQETPPEEGHPLHERRFFGDKPAEIVAYIKSDFPNHIVFIQNGYFWETYDEDARICSSIFGWKVADRGLNGVFTGVPTNARKFIQRLQEMGVSFVFVKQAEYPSPTKEVERIVSDLFTGPEG